MAKSPAPRPAQQRAHATRKALAVAGLLSLVAVAFAAALAGCDSYSYEGSPVAPAGQQRPEARSFEDYAQRCLKATKKFRDATVVFDPDIAMTKDRASTVTAAVTLDANLPADTLLPDADAATRKVAVACEVEAGLVADSGDFGVTPAGFSTQSVLEGQDAVWHWLVTPKRTGDFTVILQLRPVVLVGSGSGEYKKHNVTTLSQPSAVHVTHANWAAAAKDWLSSTTGMLTALGTAVAAVAGAVVAVHQLFVKPRQAP
ncbi:hypothetical protein [Actinoplanes sp. RD1]|uniref:hypothetical protein n=1 Tax=Actinoplanes sp. RD1 TaxID=3064538 RepID=UPI002740C093|nr:hypothetical protein [Actinoplanes sp. RD1]